MTDAKASLEAAKTQWTVDAVTLFEKLQDMDLKRLNAARESLLKYIEFSISKSRKTTEVS